MSLSWGKGVVIGLLMIGLIACQQQPTVKRDKTLPQKPYVVWQIGGMYPKYFQVDTLRTLIKNQYGEWYGAGLLVGRNGVAINDWGIVPGLSPSALDTGAELPEEIYVCWASFYDQVFYRSHLTIPLWARQKMVEPQTYYSYARQAEHVGYYNRLTLGFAPNGHIKAWLSGIPVEGLIEVATGESEVVPSDGSICPNPYPDGKIQAVSTEDAQWIKEHGVPALWQQPAPQLHWPEKGEK